MVIAICAERLIGIRSFQHSKTNWSYCTTAHIIVIIIAGSALLTSYNHFSYHCIVKLLCNETQIISKCFDVIQETYFFLIFIYNFKYETLFYLRINKIF